MEGWRARPASMGSRMAADKRDWRVERSSGDCGPAGPKRGRWGWAAGGEDGHQTGVCWVLAWRSRRSLKRSGVWMESGA